MIKAVGGVFISPELLLWRRDQDAWTITYIQYIYMRQLIICSDTALMRTTVR
jgi:hypothetical protein